MEDVEQHQPPMSIIHLSTWSKAGFASTPDCHFCAHCWGVGTSPLPGVQTAPFGLAVDTNPGHGTLQGPWLFPSAHTHHCVGHCAVTAPPCAASPRADLSVNPHPPSSGIPSRVIPLPSFKLCLCSHEPQMFQLK